MKIKFQQTKLEKNFMLFTLDCTGKFKVGKSYICAQYAPTNIQREESVVTGP